MDLTDLPQQADVVFVGAGHNALVGAAYLLDAGRSVCLLEQMARPGGCRRPSWAPQASIAIAGRRCILSSPAVRSGPSWDRT